MDHIMQKRIADLIASIEGLQPQLNKLSEMFREEICSSKHVAFDK